MTAKAVLYYVPQMEGLARRIAEGNKDVQLGAIEWNAFKDGQPNIDILKVEGSRQMRGAFLVSFDGQDEFYRQLSTIVWIAAKAGTQGLKVLMPYFPGQMDRADTISKVVTAKTLAMLLSCAPTVEGSPVEYVFYDIHSLHTENYFNLLQVRTRLKTATKYLRRDMLQDDDMIWCPDKGGYNRFKVFFDGSRSGRAYELGYCDKDRIPGSDKRKVVIKEGDPRGRHCVIVDDMVQGGGTMIECKDVLLAAGAAKVSCFATHWVCPEDSWQRFIDCGFANVWLTDSFPKTADKVAGKGQFKIISLAESLTRVILGQDDEAVGKSSL